MDRPCLERRGVTGSPSWTGTVLVLDRHGPEGNSVRGAACAGPRGASNPRAAGQAILDRHDSAAKLDRHCSIGRTLDERHLPLTCGRVRSSRTAESP